MKLTTEEILSMLLKELKIKSLSSLEKIAKIGNGTLGKAIKNDTELSSDTIEKLTSAYPNINRTFLKEGKLPIIKEGFIVDDFREFMIKKTIKNEALLETILELLAEMSVKENGSIVQKINELKKAALDKSHLISDNS